MPRNRPANTGAVEVNPPMPRTACGLNLRYIARQSDKLSTKRRVNPKNAGENGEGSPTVGNFSTWKLLRPESARASISFSEINSITSWPRSRSTSATAMPGKRCPPVPPHAITAFMNRCSDWFDVSDSWLNPCRHSGVDRGAFHLRRFKNALPINVQQQTDAEHA